MYYINNVLPPQDKRRPFMETVWKAASFFLICPDQMPCSQSLKKGYHRHPGSLRRLLIRLGLRPGKAASTKEKHVPMPYDTPTSLGVKWQMDVKYVPAACYASQDGQKFYQYTMRRCGKHHRGGDAGNPRRRLHAGGPGVWEDHRRSGYGRRLQEIVFAEARRRGVRTPWAATVAAATPMTPSPRTAVRSRSPTILTAQDMETACIGRASGAWNRRSPAGRRHSCSAGR